MGIGKTARRYSDQNGFSLIELLLVSALLPVITFAVFANFSAGTRLWNRLRSEVPEEDTAIFRQKVSQELGQSLLFNAIPFTIGEEGVTFPGFLPADERFGDRKIGEITYFHDAEARRLMRRTRTLTDIHTDKQGQVGVLLDRVDAFAVDVLYFDGQYKDYKWEAAWRAEAKDERPIALRFRLTRPEGDIAPTFQLGSGS